MKTIRIFLMTLLVAGMFLGCDKVEEPYLINKGPVGSSGGETGKRVVLVEEFTGHYCPNCPEASLQLQTYKALYGDQIIVIAIHAGWVAYTYGGDFTADYQTPAGTELNSYFGVSANPSGMVSRKEFGGSRILDKDEWQAPIEQLIAEDALAEIALESDYNDSDRTAEITVEMEVLNPETLDYKFCLVVIENDIVSPQKNNNPNVGDTPAILDWQHKHMLRGDVNGTWGETIDATTGATSKTYSYTLPAEWDEENCAFIGFIYRDDTKEILHAAEVDVK